MTASSNHLNPISALAGRSIVCGPALWLHWHGFDLSEREADIQAFYEDPESNASLLSKYNVDYILFGPGEKAISRSGKNTLDILFENIYSDESNEYNIYKVNNL